MAGTCLVIQEARLGDLIQSKPVMDDLTLAGTRTVLLVRPGISSFARSLGIGDEVLSWPSFGDPESGQPLLSRLSGAKDFVGQLRKKKIDRVVVLNHHGTGIVLARLLGVPVFGFTEMFSPSNESERPSHLSGWPGYLVASSRGIRALNRIHLSDMWRGFVGPKPASREQLPAKREHRGGPVVVVLGGRSPFRRLEPDVLLALLKALKRVDGGQIVLTGGQEDASLGARLEREAGEGVVNLAGKTGFRELSDLISSAGVVFSPDTAPLHLAASLGIPSVGLFFAGALPFETGAYREGALSLVTTMECYPCAGEGSSCAHRSCRDALGSERTAALIAAVRRGASANDLLGILGDTGGNVDLMEAVSTPSGVLQRVVTPRLLTRERLLARLFRRFYWRYLGGSRDGPSLSEELGMEGALWSGGTGEKEGSPPDPLWMGRLEQGASLYIRLREAEIQGVQKQRMVDRLAAEFPMIWPLLHHLEWVEGGLGDLRSFLAAAEGLVAEIGEAGRSLVPLNGRAAQNKERTHVAI